MKTLVVNTENGLVLINAEDFNAEIHTLAEGEDVPQIHGAVIVPPEFDLEALKAQIRRDLEPEIRAAVTAELEPQLRAAIMAEMMTVATPGDATAGDGADTLQGASDTPPPALATPVVTPAAPLQLLVTKKSKKHIVISADGAAVTIDGIEAGGYDTEQAAWDAILALPK